MNLFADLRTLVLDSLIELQSSGALPAGLDFANVAVEPPRDALHGDMSTNAAMVLAKAAKSNPRVIAEALAGKLIADDRVQIADVAGPGFLNFKLNPSCWTAIIPAALSAGKNFGRATLGQGKEINVEFVSANPTGPLHVGHTRGAVFGDALASLLDFVGYNVTREYYINDGGAQVDALARSCYLRYLEANGQEVAFEDGTYPGDYLVPVGVALKEKFGDRFVNKTETEWLSELRSFGIEAMMDMIRADLKALNIEMDVFYSEKSLYGTGQIEAAIDDLDSKGLIYEGVLDPPKGKKPDDWEPREQILFKSTEHGDDVDRPIKKSDGVWTYFAPDIAYHYDKISRGFDEMIDIFGADHGGYVKRMKAAVSALSDGKVEFDIKLTQLVKLFKNGEPFKMSKRAGTFIMLRDLVEQVGPDVTRFHMLTRKQDAPLDFDFDKVLEQSKENPVFYVQYANARIHSVMRKAQAAGVDTSDTALQMADFSQNTHAAELALLRKIAEWPRLLELAAKHKEPHRISFYLYELAAEYHSLHNLVTAEPHLRFWQEDNTVLSLAKIAQIRAVSVVLSTGLAILGVTAMEEM